MEKKLKSKRKVILKEMSIDDMDNCNYLQHICQESDGGISIYGLNKSNTAWIRKGLSGGDFKVAINGVIPDSVIKELSVTEKTELVELIREYITMGE